MESVKIRNINLNVTPSTIGDYLMSCIKAIISRRGIYPTSAFTSEDQRRAQDIKIERNIEAVVSDVEGLIKYKKKITVVVAIRTQDCIILENWFLYINVLCHKKPPTSTTTFLPKLIDYLNQIMFASGQFLDEKQSYFFDCTVYVNYPNT